MSWNMFTWSIRDELLGGVCVKLLPGLGVVWGKGPTPSDLKDMFEPHALHCHSLNICDKWICGWWSIPWLAANQSKE
ncbi:hypothetical protein PAXINDRAFT_9034 [Paxillus involutus ATCC 200175]|nr:hypothetical protein PAXINDRAFT_9034 [Paxillus involutus ATCC 200175]